MASRVAALTYVGLSIPAGLLTEWSAQAAARPPVSAEQAMAVSRAMTSIGRDPCRAGSDDPDAEIVVCGRLTNPYEVPLYATKSDGGLGKAGMAAEFAADEAKRLSAGCHARGESCLEPLPVIGVPFGKGTKGPVRIGKD